MTVKEFIDNILEITNSHPEVLNFKVVYAIDEEGNCFNAVEMEPEIGFSDPDVDINMTIEWSKSRKPEDLTQYNVLCIN